MKKILGLLILLPAIIFAQELEATVMVNMEQLNSDARFKLENFENQVTEYLNSTKFTGDYWEYEKIKCSFNIFFTASSAGNDYRAQIVINSSRPIYKSPKTVRMFNIMDEKWMFHYEKNQSMIFNDFSFNSLTSFFDYYALVIIGLDMDSYGPEPYGGNTMYNKALEIAIRGNNDGKYSEGWQTSSAAYSRRGLIGDLTSNAFDDFRADYKDFHFNGIDMLAQNRVEAHKNILKLINHLYDKRKKMNSRSVLIKVFFDARAGNLINYLEGYPKLDEVVSKLRIINPSNTSKYDKSFKAIRE